MGGGRDGVRADPAYHARLDFYFSFGFFSADPGVLGGPYRAAELVPSAPLLRLAPLPPRRPP
jgi:hypothetical protein